MFVSCTNSWNRCYHESSIFLHMIWAIRVGYCCDVALEGRSRSSFIRDTGKFGLFSGRSVRTGNWGPRARQQQLAPPA